MFNKTARVPDAKFDAAFAAFLEGCKKISAANTVQIGTHDGRVNQSFIDAENARPWSVDYGVKRLRVVHGGSAFCFVDYATGDVLKCAGWKAPAPHARGNIYDPANGLGTMGPYGPAYLR